MHSRLSLVSSCLATTALVAGAGVLAAPASAATSYQVVIHTSTAKLEFGRSVLVTGKVTGGPVRGLAVRLYWTRASTSDSWHKIGRLPLGKHGHFRVRYRPRAGGDIRFQVRKSGVGSHAGARAKSRVAAVYQWQPVWRALDAGDVRDGDLGGTAVEGKATMDGVVYRHSLLINDSVQVDLASTGCDALRGLVGITDDASAMQGVFEVIENTNPGTSVVVPRDHSPVTYGTDLDPTGGVTLYTQIDGHGDTDGAMVLASPQLHCDAPAS